jgi:Family of unknown function (DUF5677)
MPIMMTRLLGQIHREIRSKAQFSIIREGLFRGVAKGALVKAYDLVCYTHRIKTRSQKESSFFVASALRGICEDLIALKFLRRLKRDEREEIVTIRMLMATAEASRKQAEFFKRRRPFQPVLQFQPDAESIRGYKDRITQIGKESELWRTEQKLPPIEQMANKVNLRWLYDFIYSGTSEVVHFNPRIVLRSGWGPCSMPAGHKSSHHPLSAAFSTKNFWRYYLDFNRTYSLYLFILFVNTFKKDLSLNRTLVNNVRKMQVLLDDEIRWPELLTYEEMNQTEPGPLARAILKIVHDAKKSKKKADRRQRHQKLDETHPTQGKPLTDPIPQIALG